MMLRDEQRDIKYEPFVSGLASALEFTPSTKLAVTQLRPGDWVVPCQDYVMDNGQIGFDKNVPYRVNQIDEHKGRLYIVLSSRINNLHYMSDEHLVTFHKTNVL